MKNIGSCEHCGQQFAYQLVHNGFNDTAYAYCDTCGCTAFLSGWTPKPEGAALRIHERITKDLERFLDTCGCGGHFRADAVPRCPHCKKGLSATAAATWLEANAPGTAKGWRWQRDWKGLYCIVIEQQSVNDPWKADLLPH